VRIFAGMSDEKPNPFSDVRRGLGLLFRAAKTTVEKLPRKDLEEVVVTSAREVGRALENVGRTLEREVFGKSEFFGKKAEEQGHEPSSGSGKRGPHPVEHEDPPRSSEPPDEPKPPDAA